MPGLDGTGPYGTGPMTGGGRGFCAVPIRSAWPAYAGMGFQMPYGVPWGLSYHRAPSLAPQVTPEGELDYLKDLVQSMRDDLKDIEARIQEIENKKRSEVKT